jgi:hypothetical protein
MASHFLFEEPTSFAGMLGGMLQGVENAVATRTQGGVMGNMLNTMGVSTGQPGAKGFPGAAKIIPDPYSVAPPTSVDPPSAATSEIAIAAGIAFAVGLGLGCLAFQKKGVPEGDSDEDLDSDDKESD